jgi:hypothetical protein
MPKNFFSVVLFLILHFHSRSSSDSFQFITSFLLVTLFKAVLRIRIRIRRIRMFLVLLDPDPLVRGMDPRIQIHGSRSTDPDPHQNVVNPQHWFKGHFVALFDRHSFCETLSEHHFFILFLGDPVRDR